MKQSIIPILFSIIFIGMIPSQAHCNDYAISDEQAHLIILNGTPEDVKRLIQSGYDVNKVYKCNTLLNTAIKSAARGAQMSRHPSYALEKIKILVENGTDVNLVPCPGKSMAALNWAISLPIQTQHMEQMVNKEIDKMIERGYGECNIPAVISKPCNDITERDKEQIKENIHNAFVIKNKQLVPYFMDIIQYLASHGSIINGSEENGMKMAPIHLAALNPDEVTLEPLKYLIEKKANVNILDINGNTPLFFAYGIGNIKATELLINSGADTNIRNMEGAVYNEVTAQKMTNIFSENGL